MGDANGGTNSNDGNQSKRIAERKRQSGRDLRETLRNFNYIRK